MSKKLKLSTRKFYKTRIVVEVLSENPLSEGLELDSVHWGITNGDWSGTVKWHPPQKLNGKQAAAALRKQGSDPGWFQLTDKGEDATE